MKLSSFFAAMAMSISISSTASAQNLQLNEAPAVIESATTQWVTSFLIELGLSVGVAAQSAESDILQVTMPGGGVFYAAIRDCDASTPRNCNTIEPFILFDGAGIVLSQLNNATRDHLAVSRGVLLEDGNGVLGTKIILAGGVTSKNVLIELAAFFGDIDKLFAAIQSGPRAEVNFELSAQSTQSGMSKIDNDATDENYIVNKVGRNAPKFLTEEIEALFD